MLELGRPCKTRAINTLGQRGAALHAAERRMASAETDRTKFQTH